MISLMDDKNFKRNMGFNKDHFQNYSYVDTVFYKDRVINVFSDDYGQCYFFVYWSDQFREFEQVGCGTYNTDYKGTIEDYFKSDTEQLRESFTYLRDNVRELSKEMADLEKSIKYIKKKVGRNYGRSKRTHK